MLNFIDDAIVKLYEKKSDSIIKPNFNYLHFRMISIAFI